MKILMLCFGLSIFLGSFLLFFIQPLFTKMALPLLGGAPMIWNTLVVFFQGTLLLGYLYAHGTSKFLTPKKQGVLHIILLFSSFLTLPISVNYWHALPDNTMPIIPLFMLSLFGVGMPFFLLSANAPLISRWFHNTKHPNAMEPYHLYSISNVGSLGALLLYPFLFEYFFTLPIQKNLWHWGYVLFVLSILAVQWQMWTHLQPEQAEKSRDEKPITWLNRLLWISLSFIPSSLLLGVTSYISTDISSVPLLWIIPLALYLLTFTLSFARKEIISLTTLTRFSLLGLLIITMLYATGLSGDIKSIPFHLLTFFFICWTLHKSLVSHKPSPSHLTEFYLWMSLGGVLGGLFNILVAPIVFNVPYEYPLVIGLAFLFMPTKIQKSLWKIIVVDTTAISLILIAFLLISIPVITGWGTLSLSTGYAWDDGFIKCLVLFILFFISFKKPYRFALTAAGIFIMGMTLPQISSNHVYTERSFFGSYRLLFSEERLSYELWSGNGLSMQGRQDLIGEHALKITALYPLEGLAQSLPESTFERMGSIGLGVGVMACFGAKENVFYEIDPLVAHIAVDSGEFTYLSDCPNQTSEVILGDGRLKLSEEADNSFSLLVLDAFNGTAIPAHLLTQEAFSLYLAKLKKDGVLLMNVTNIHLNLSPLIQSLTNSAGLVVYENHLKDGSRDARFMIASRDEKYLGKVPLLKNWKPLTVQPLPRPWTDSYSNIIPLIK